MKKLLYVWTCLLITTAAPALYAQASSTADCMGVYFDIGANNDTYDTSSGFEMVTGYFCLTNLTDSGGVAAWEAKIDIEGSPLAGSWQMGGNGLNIEDSGSGLFNVGLGLSPDALLPDGNVAVLATWSGTVMQTTDEIKFYISAFPGSVTSPDAPCYISGDDVTVVVPCAIQSGPTLSDANAVINLAFQGENADKTWGEVKSLYE
jgi:hypothetical protein